MLMRMGASSIGCISYNDPLRELRPARLRRGSCIGGNERGGVMYA